jgi:tricorn protease
VSQHRVARILPSLLVLLLGLAPAVGAQTKLLRFPDIHGDKVVFSYAGDLWLAPASGGLARRLTAHPGVELFAKFSPDGRWIAFTGQYDGDEQVYVIPVEGGVPRQLTFYPAQGPLPPRWGYDNQVYGWSPDGKSILFRSLRDAWDAAEGRLYLISREGGLPVALPMPQSGAGDFSPDGKKLVYSPLFRDFRSWKRYQGGWAQDLYVFDLASQEAEPITNQPRTDRDPMWIGDRIYFASDRDGTLNLYVYDPATKETRQLTHSQKWDLRWPSADQQGQIVYELNGELQIYGTRTGRDQKLSIQVPDDGLGVRPSRVSAEKQIEDYELSPKGERALFVARGDIFTVPIEKGVTRNLTRSSGAHDKWARWSPDGRKIAFLSDRTGEEEVHVIDQDGSGELEALTHGGQAMRYAPEWSPDGKRLAFSDKDGKLYVLTLEDKKLIQIADEPRGQVRDYTWSPDGGHVAFSLSDSNLGFRSLYLWSVADGQLRQITGGLFHEFNPAWDPEGNYLYYLSAREYAPQLGSFELNYLVDREVGIFALALRKDVKHPFPPESDEVTIEGKEAKEAEGKEKKDNDKDKEKEKEKKKEPVRIDFDGLADRVARVPVAADNIQGLAAIPDHLLYLRGIPFFLGREIDQEPALKIFPLKDRKEKVVAEKVQSYAVSADGSKVLVRHKDDFKLYPVPPKSEEPKTVSTKGLQVDRVPAEEWTQMFDEVWRRFRDFFYVAKMHGYDWKGLREQYRPWLEHVGHRSDLNYVISEMISELNVSHAYISGGDFQIPDRPQVALPGARFELDSASGRYRIARIFRGQNEEERYRSPLTEIGLGVAEGDYVLAIDGQDLSAKEDPYRLLRHKADLAVELTLNRKPSREGARKVTFRPIASETNLIYLDWVTRNREKVASLTEGRVGYLHIPDMGEDGIREFIKYFYGQIRKAGLVIDVRSNGGGFVSQTLIERLRRNLLGVDYGRTSDEPSTYPDAAFHGHLVCLLNETSASDGDIFPHMFRQAGLGPLIGKRSWGGVVGITNRGPLIDGGQIFVPEFGTATAEGQWAIEGHGVDPDMVVENTPKSVIEGRDLQLERGVEEVMNRIRTQPRQLPQRPPDPVKTK